MGPLFLFFVYFFPVILIFISKHLEMTKFDEAEEKGRSITERLISGNCLNYEFQPTNSRIDLFVTGFTEKAAVEIKDRERYTSEEIEGFGGMYIKWTKYCSLTATTLNGYKPIFLTIFKDKITMWDIANTDITWEDKYLPNTEVINTGKSIQKVGYLHVKDAIAVYETENYRTISE